MAVATKFFTTVSSKVASIPVVDGQVIALSDRAAWFYDMDSSRHAVIGTNIVTTNLPEQGIADTLYILSSANDSGVYIWKDGSFKKIAELNKEYIVFHGASNGNAGTSGLVPAPDADATSKFLKGDGSWSAVETTDTKNTAGATASDEKLYIIGATEQSENPKTHTNSKAYVKGGKLYSNGNEVANLSDEQAFINKTYEGYTLGNAVAKSVASTIAESDEGLATAKQVYTELQKILNDAKSYTNSAVADVIEFNIEVVDSLPENDIKEHTIYLTPSDKSEDKNNKIEYLYINGSWEMIGSTAVDLTGYVKQEQMTAAISEAIAQVDTGLSIVDGKLCITYETN